MKVLHDPQTLRATLKTRESSDITANWINASQPWFKVAAGLGVAALSVGTGGSFPAMLAAGLGLGAMIGIKLKKLGNPADEDIAGQMILEDLLSLPWFNKGYYHLFKDKDFQRRLKDVSMGDLENYKDLPAEVKKAQMKFNLGGLVACGMLFGQIGADNPLDVLKAFPGLSPDDASLETHKTLINASKTWEQEISKIQKIPEVAALLDRLESIKNPADLSMENILNGLALDDKAIERLRNEHQDTLEQVGKVLALAKQSSDANDQVQSAMDTKKNGTASLGAFVKNKEVAEGINRIETRIKTALELPNIILKEMYLDLRGKTTELKTRQSEFRSKSKQSPYKP